MHNEYTKTLEATRIITKNKQKILMVYILTLSMYLCISSDADTPSSLSLGVSLLLRPVLYDRDERVPVFLDKLISDCEKLKMN